MNFKRHNLRLLEFSFLTTTFHMPLLTSSSRSTLKAHVLVSQLKKTDYICINNKAQVLPPAMTSCTLVPSTTHRAQAYGNSLIQLMHCPPLSPSALFVSHAVCTASTISPILMGSTITLMWMVPSLSFANPKSSCWPTHFWLLNQTIHSHVHWPLTLNTGPEESNTLCLNHRRPLVATPNALWHGISGSFLLPTLVRTSHLSHVCLLTPYMSCAICPNYIFFPQAFQTHATRRNVSFPHSSTELHWCLQHLSETCIHIQLPNLENYVLADFISSTKPTTWLTVQLNFWTDQVEDRGHRNNSQGKIMSLPIFISSGFNNKR